MEVTYHIGLHSTDEDRALACLRANADRLRRAGVAVPAPQRARDTARKAMLAARGAPATTTAQTRFLTDAGVQDRPSRMVLSSDSFRCVPRRALENGTLYPTASERARWLRALFPESGARICMGVRNPITWLPAVHARFGAETGFSDWVGDARLDDLSWIDVIARLHEAVPDAEIVLWCHEDMPLIWPDILAAMIAPEGDTHGLAALENVVSELIHPEAASRLEEHLAQTVKPSARKEACRAFLDRFARPDAMSSPLSGLMADTGWSADFAARVTDAYERDLAALRQVPEVTFLAP